MKTFDVQAIELQSAYQRAFDYIADPRNLPRWTNAFQSIAGEQAQMVTPEGTIDVELKTKRDFDQGTIDWTITFPDGSKAHAYSRLVAVGEQCIYSFLLTQPPVPLERLEGALEQQSITLREELSRLRNILEQ